MFKYVLIAALVACVVAVHDGYYVRVMDLRSDVRPDGFSYNMDLSNNVRSHAVGDEHGNMRGSFEWVSPEGLPVKIDYVADENGYQPKGDVLPTPPPVPVAILKSLEQPKVHETYKGTPHYYYHPYHY